MVGGPDSESTAPDNDIQDKFGMDGYTSETRDDGGSSRFSWDTDSRGNYIDDSAHINKNR